MPENKQSLIKQVISSVVIAIISGAILALLGVDKLWHRQGQTSSVTTSAPIESKSAPQSESTNAENTRLTADCLNEPSYLSIPSKRESTFTITNSSQETVTGYWLDFQGNRQKYFVLQPNQKIMQKTFIGHYWVITDMSGRCNRVIAAPGDFILE